MKISTKGEYALRALIVLGQHYEEVLSAADISEKTLVPYSYMEQILQLLKSLGFVKSKRGIHGGYSLRYPPEQISIGEVIRRIEGPLAPMHCVSITRYEPCPLESMGCLLQPLWALIRDTIAEVLDRTTLEQLINRNIMMHVSGGKSIG